MALKKAEPRPTQAVDTEKLLQPGTEIICEMADFDACDLYRLRIDERGEHLRFSYWMTNEEDLDGGEEADAENPTEQDPDGVVVSLKQALDDGHGVVFLSQGSVSVDKDEERRDDHRYAQNTPPFLVSRNFVETLRSGQPARLSIYGEDTELVLAGTDAQKLRINDREMLVSTLHASSDAMQVWILDDARWPLLLRAEFQGDNYIVLQSLKAA